MVITNTTAIFNAVTDEERFFVNNFKPTHNLVTAAIYADHPGLVHDPVTRKAYLAKMIKGKVYAAIGNWAVKL